MLPDADRRAAWSSPLVLVCDGFASRGAAAGSASLCSRLVCWSVPAGLPRLRLLATGGWFSPVLSTGFLEVVPLVFFLVLVVVAIVLVERGCSTRAERLTG